jgi:hypothetical protein
MMSTVDFQHAIHTMEAVKAGCDVCRKANLRETMEDNRAVLKSSKRICKLCKFGSQRRSGPNYFRQKNLLNRVSLIHRNG